MDKRVTIVLGAGAALELAKSGCDWPTTENVTRKILDEKPEKIDPISKSKIKVSLINDIYNKLCSSYNEQGNCLDPDAKGSAAIFHFEKIFHILELLDTYNWYRSKNVAPFSSFIKINFTFDPIDLIYSSRHIIEKIIDVVKEYDDSFSEDRNEWYRSFWKEKCKQWDVFNLNYDTTIEQSLGDYEDGYESIPDEPSFERFNINKLLDNKFGKSTINHIHGCILYGHDRYLDANHDVYDFENQDMYKWPNSNIAKEKWSGISTSNQYAQNGQTIIQGPIITGLSKTDKITCLPYDIYRYNLLRSVRNNKGLLIAGYSFGDKYVNNVLTRMSQCHGDEKRVVLIDYWDIKGFCKKNNEDDVVCEDSINPRIFEHFFSSGDGNGEMLMFIKRIVHQDCSVWNNFKSLSFTGPMVSNNDQLMLYIGGMRDALENHKQEIYNFLGM